MSSAARALPQVDLAGAEVAAARRLVARTVRLPDGLDPRLLAVGSGPDGVLWQRERAGLAGRGEALRIALPEGLEGHDGPSRVAAVLDAIATHDEVGLPGCGPVAIGALPFDRNAPGSLVVPAVVTGRATDGTAWITTVAPAGAPAPDVRATLAERAALAAVTPPDGFSLVSAKPHAEWCALVGSAVAAIRAGRFAKVVLAREVWVEANRPLVVADILQRLEALYPSCMVFRANGLLGASPELLVRRTGRELASHPLAGTIPHSGDPEVDQRLTDALMASPKEREEHRHVVEAVAGALGQVCDRLDVPAAPSIVSLRNVSHLGTSIRGQMRPGEAASALDLVARLHPTPAVGGTPTDEAVAYLHEVEGFDRGRYAGPVGWIDRNGDGAWAVAIRSAEVEGNRARLFAGVGVVADSDPGSELVETQLKLQALLAAVVRP